MSQRKFVFLDSIDGSFTNSKNVKGHAQFDETKNKCVLKLFIEGLSKEEFGVDLVFDNGSCENIGSFYGQNKTEKSFYLNHLIKDLGVVLVYPLIDKKNIVLVGYLKDKDKYNIKDIAYSRINSKTESPKGKEVEISKPTVSKPKEAIIEKETPKSIDHKEGLPVKDLKETKVEGTKENTLEETIESKLQEEQKADTTSEQKGGVFNNQIFYLWENLNNLDHYLAPAEPFKQAIPRHKWWKIKESDTDIQYYCILYNGYLMPMVYPFMNYKNISMVERDWVFGTVTEEYGEKEVLKYFVYGIPGKFYMQEQPFKGSTGYLYWQSEDIINREPVGYWLLYVDVHTGKIVIPRRPVKPPLNKNIMHNDL